MLCPYRILFKWGEILYEIPKVFIGGTNVRIDGAVDEAVVAVVDIVAVVDVVVCVVSVEVFTSVAHYPRNSRKS